MLYKYRSLENFKFFVDIILNNRLFVAPYFHMNDPMEGHYLYRTNELTDEVLTAIKGEKEKLKICSLSRVHNKGLMWSHYANGHSGVAIGVEVNGNNYDIRPVTYDGLSTLQTHRNNPTQETAKRILCHKLDFWGYEEEERVFTTGGAKYIDVEVKEVFLGIKMSTQDKSLVIKLIDNANVGRTTPIEIHRFDEPPA